MREEIKHIVVHGNPVDGFSFVGPFKEFHDAAKWAELEVADQTWWIADLTRYVP